MTPRWLLCTACSLPASDGCGDRCRMAIESWLLMLSDDGCCVDDPLRCVLRWPERCAGDDPRRK
jgi:hypothetical protein